MACNKATLLSDAISNQFTGVEPNVWNALVLQLLCEIKDNGGGGGGGNQQVFANLGDPNGIVAVSHTDPAICLDFQNMVEWWKTDGIASDTGWY